MKIENNIYNEELKKTIRQEESFFYEREAYCNEFIDKLKHGGMGIEIKNSLKPKEIPERKIKFLIFKNKINKIFKDIMDVL